MTHDSNKYEQGFLSLERHTRPFVCMQHSWCSGCSTAQVDLACATAPLPQYTNPRHSTHSRPRHPNHTQCTCLATSPNSLNTNTQHKGVMSHPCAPAARWWRLWCPCGWKRCARCPGGRPAGGVCLSPVAVHHVQHVHQGGGAELWRVNWSRTKHSTGASIGWYSDTCRHPGQC